MRSVNLSSLAATVSWLTHVRQRLGHAANFASQEILQRLPTPSGEALTDRERGAIRLGYVDQRG